MYEDDEKFPLTDVMEIHFVEMTKLIRAWYNQLLDPWNDVLARWLLLLGAVDRRSNKIYDDIYRELEAIAMEDPVLLQAFQSWQELSSTKEQVLEYESRLKQLLDEEAAVREAELRVQEAELRVQEAELRVQEAELRAIEAKEKGKVEEKFEIARKMILDGFDNGVIAKLTELSVNQIERVRRELQ